MAIAIVTFILMFAAIVGITVWRLYYDISYDPYGQGPHIIKMPKDSFSTAKWIAIADDDDITEVIDSLDLKTLDMDRLAGSYLIGRGRTPRTAVRNMADRWLSVAEEVDLTQ